MEEESFPSFLDEAVQTCPFPAYARLRDEAPIYKEEATGFWVLTRYEDVKSVAADWQRFSNVTDGGRSRPEPVRRLYAEQGYAPVSALVRCDPPTHRNHRAALSAVLGREQVKALEPYITRAADELIDGFAGRGTVEFFHEFAMELPVRIIAHCLGVPDHMRGNLREWTAAAHAAANIDAALDIQLDAAQTLIVAQKYFAERMTALAAAPDSSLLSQIACASNNTVALSMEERLMIVIQVMVAGNETTSSILASAVLRMAVSAGIEAELRAEPSCISQYVEECLRLDAPMQGLFRRAKCDLSLSGFQIFEDDIVVLRWGSANRDERQFDCPEQVDLARKNAHSHLSFGYGIHFCPGKELARAEIRITLERLLGRLKDFRLAAGKDSTHYHPNYAFFGLRHLDLAFSLGREMPAHSQAG